MFELLRSLRRNKRLLIDFVKRDLKARYVGSSMGFFWSVVFPIVNLFVYMFVFRMVLGARWSDKQGGFEVALIMLTGIVVWAAFAETVSRTTNTLVENSNLIQKVVFPSEVLPVYLTLSSLINMCIGLPVVLLGVVYFGYVDPVRTAVEVTSLVQQAALPDPLSLIYLGYVDPVQTAAEVASMAQPLVIPDPLPPPLGLGLPLVTLPILFLLQVVFTVGLGYILSTLNLYLRDTYHLIGVFITVWMFSTPIFYPAAMVEKKGFGVLLQVNPMHWLIDSYRKVLLYDTWPDGLLLLRFAVVAVIVLALGSRFFMSQKKRFPDML